MVHKKLTALVAALLCICGYIGSAAAAEVDCDSIYCFSQEDFAQEKPLAGICITSVPKSAPGTLRLGERTVQPGDILTVGQLEAMTFLPRRSETDQSLAVGYLPIYEDSVGTEAVMTLSIRGKEDKAPVAEDSALETYKNLPIEGKLKVTDPEGQPLSFTVTRQPKRGTLEIREDGSFTYTPKKNKVGVDSFVYTAADPAGKLSREATVTVTILKASDAPQYTDTTENSCRFAAEWMKNTGIFVGENLDGNACFQPEHTVSRGEFTAMLVKALELMEQEEVDFTGYEDEIPRWLRPYVAAAVRSGLTAGLPQQETFEADVPITGAEAAVMLQNALDLGQGEMSEAPQNDEIPVWASNALETMSIHGMTMEANEPLTRADAAQLLYRAATMAKEQSHYLVLDQ